MQSHQPPLGQDREDVVHTAMVQVALRDCPFTLDEFCRARKTSKDIAPGSDGIPHSFLRQLEPAGELTALALVNVFWDMRQLPAEWKRRMWRRFPSPGTHTATALPSSCSTLARLLSGWSSIASFNGWGPSIIMGMALQRE
ncbi:uncharacterized protein LOC143036493 isoform X1 [Oratosquilla oratoria]|uniref:uncharacterized protein LOC143036493 isoform X1 n=1 Tax=Oratosquilla oratoria TaxID=337810 RepID=UPI003F75F47E